MYHVCTYMNKSKQKVRQLNNGAEQVNNNITSEVCQISERRGGKQHVGCDL